MLDHHKAQLVRCHMPENRIKSVIVRCADRESTVQRCKSKYLCCAILYFAGVDPARQWLKAGPVSTIEPSKWETGLEAFVFQLGTRSHYTTGQAVVKALKDQSVDAVCMGTRGLGALQGALLTTLGLGGAVNARNEIMQEIS